MPRPYILNNKVQKKIRTMFFGPYLDEWRDKEGIVDNRDTAIADRLNLPISVTSTYIRELLNKHFEDMANNKVVILLLFLSAFANAQIVTFIDKNWTQASVWVDPTLTDQGFQTGYEIEKIMDWGYASASFSIYNGLDVKYRDLVGTLGVNFNMFNNNAIRYYGGWRMGFITRTDDTDKNTYPMVGATIGITIKICKHIHIGPRLWIDYREDQKDQFYGSSLLYERGFITNNPLLQENGALVFTVSW